VVSHWLRPNVDVPGRGTAGSLRTSSTRVSADDVFPSAVIHHRLRLEERSEPAPQNRERIEEHYHIACSNRARLKVLGGVRTDSCSSISGTDANVA
jgi:hypothetical protein